MNVLTADSGITILFQHVPSKLVSARYYVRCGSLDEQIKGEYGLCHALEHMFFSGSKTRSWEDFTSGFRKIGAYSNASTYYGETEYEILVPRENFSKAFDLLADMLYNSTFPEDRWEKVEKPAVVNELLSFENSPDWVLENLTFIHALGGDNYYHDPIGDLDSIQRAGIEELITFRDRFYKGENLFLSITGDLTEQEVLGIVSKWDLWKNNTPEQKIRNITTFDYDCIEFFKEGCGQPLIYSVKPIRKTFSVEEKSVSHILMSILNNHLMREIREKKGLCYGIHGTIFNELPDEDYLTINTSISDAALKEETITSIHEALVSLVNTALTDDEIQQARMDVYREVLSYETCPATVSSWLAEEWLRGNKDDPISSTHHFIQTVTNEQVRGLAEEFVSGDYKITTLEDFEECEKA